MGFGFWQVGFTSYQMATLNNFRFHPYMESHPTYFMYPFLVLVESSSTVYQTFTGSYFGESGSLTRNQLFPSILLRINGNRLWHATGIDSSSSSCVKCIPQVRNGFNQPWSRTLTNSYVYDRTFFCYERTVPPSPKSCTAPTQRRREKPIIQIY